MVRKSDDYIIVLDDSFTVESISEEGRSLSEQLPQTVVSVGMENNEALELIVWQNGMQTGWMNGCVILLIIPREEPDENTNYSRIIWSGA